MGGGCDSKKSSPTWRHCILRLCSFPSFRWLLIAWDVGGGQYQFLGKVPLKATGVFIAPAILAVVVAFFMIQSNADTTGSRPIQNTTSSSLGTITSSQPGSTDKDNLRESIEQERARLKMMKGTLITEGAQIRMSRRALLHRRLDKLNSGSPSQRKSIVTKRTGELLMGESKFCGRLGRHKADLNSFNAQVNRLELNALRLSTRCVSLEKSVPLTRLQDALGNSKELGKSVSHP